MNTQLKTMYPFVRPKSQNFWASPGLGRVGGCVVGTYLCIVVVGLDLPNKVVHDLVQRAHCGLRVPVRGLVGHLWDGTTLLRLQEDHDELSEGDGVRTTTSGRHPCQGLHPLPALYWGGTVQAVRETFVVCSQGTCKWITDKCKLLGYDG